MKASLGFILVVVMVLVSAQTPSGHTGISTRQNKPPGNRCPKWRVPFFVLFMTITMSLFTATAAAQEPPHLACKKTFVITGTAPNGTQPPQRLVVAKRIDDYTAAEAQSVTDQYDKEYLLYGYKRIGLASKQQDCAGYILQRFISTQGNGKYFVTAPELFEKLIKPFGRLLEPNEPRKEGDILVFYQRAQPRVGHVAIVVGLDNGTPVIHTKDTTQPLYEIVGRIGSLGRIANFPNDPLVTSYLAPIYYHFDALPQVTELYPGGACDYSVDPQKDFAGFQQELASAERQVGILEGMKRDGLDKVNVATTTFTEIKTLIDPLDDEYKMFRGEVSFAEEFFTAACHELKTKQGPLIATLLAEANKQLAVIEQTLDQATKKAENCSSQLEADSIKALQSDAIRGLANIGKLEKQAKVTSAELVAAEQGFAEAELVILKDDAFIKRIETAIALARPLHTKALAIIGEADTLSKDFDTKRNILAHDFANFKARLDDTMFTQIPDDFTTRLASVGKRIDVVANSRELSDGLRDLAILQQDLLRAEGDLIFSEKGLKSMRRVCSPRPLIDDAKKISDVMLAATTDIGLAADLPQKAKECEARADCLPHIIPINDLLRIGDSEKAEPLINKLKAQGCDTKEIEDEYWRVQAKVWPLLTRARDAFGNLATTCDYMAARRAAEELQAAFPQHPWVGENLRNIQKAAMAQFEMNNLLQKAIDADDQERPTEAEAAIAQARQVAGPYACISKAVEGFNAEYEKGKSLRNKVGSLRGRIGELSGKKASAQRNAQQAANFADQAAQLLAQLYGYGDQISAIADKCRLAAALRASIESASRDALAQEKAIRSDLDDAIAKAANCTTKSDAADVQAKYNNAIRTAGQVGAAARSARQANQGELQSLLADINNGKGAYQRANELADRLAEAGGKVSSAVAATRADVQSGEALKANFSSVAVGLRAEIDKLRTDYPPDRLTPSLNDEISALYSLLDSVLVDSNNISFDGIVSAAQAQAVRVNGITSSAQAQMEKYQKAVGCNVTTADDSVEQMDGVVTGLTVELGAAADAARQASDCLKKLSATNNTKPTSQPPSVEPLPDDKPLGVSPANAAANTVKGQGATAPEVEEIPDSVEPVPPLTGPEGKVKSRVLGNPLPNRNKPRSAPPQVEEIPESPPKISKRKDEPPQVEEIPDSPPKASRSTVAPPKVEKTPQPPRRVERVPQAPPKASRHTDATPAPTQPRTPAFDTSGDWEVLWNWSVTYVTFVGKVTGDGSQWNFQGSLESVRGNVDWPAKGPGSITCSLSGAPDSPGKISCTMAVVQGTWRGEAEGRIQVMSFGEKRKFEFKGRGKSTGQKGDQAGLDHLDLAPRH